MDITDIRIHKTASDSNMKALVSITFDNSFVVHDVKVIEGKSRLFTAMPSRRVAGNDYKDVAHPISPEMRNYIEDAVLEAYSKALEEAE